MNVEFPNCALLQILRSLALVHFSLMKRASYAKFSQYPETAARSVLSMFVFKGIGLTAVIVVFEVEIGAFDAVLALVG